MAKGKAGNSSGDRATNKGSGEVGEGRTAWNEFCEGDEIDRIATFARACVRACHIPRVSWLTLSKNTATFKRVFGVRFCAFRKKRFSRGLDAEERVSRWHTRARVALETIGGKWCDRARSDAEITRAPAIHLSLSLSSQRGETRPRWIVDIATVSAERQVDAKFKRKIPRDSLSTRLSIPPFCPPPPPPPLPAPPAALSPCSFSLLLVVVYR